MKKVAALSRKFDDDILSAIENNGEVTLPDECGRKSLMSRPAFRIFLLVLGLLAIRRGR